MGIPEALGPRYNQRTFSESTTLPSPGTPGAADWGVLVPPLLQRGWLALWRCQIMRKPVRGALQGCPSKGLAASQRKSTSTKHCCFVFSSECVSRGLGWVSGGVVVLVLVVVVEGNTLLPPSDSTISFSSSTDHSSSSDGLIMPYTVTNGECDRGPCLLSYIFTKFVSVHNIA